MRFEYQYDEDKAGTHLMNGSMSSMAALTGIKK